MVIALLSALQSKLETDSMSDTIINKHVINIYFKNLIYNIY